MLEGITNSNVIQCLNAGDVTSAISFLQKGKVGTEDTIISSVRNSLEISLQNAKIKLEYTKDMIFHSEEQRDSKLKMLQEEVSGFESKLNLLNERITKNDICVICLNVFEKKSITNCCKNSFCFACICKWINTNPTCPVCKNSLSILNDLYVIDNDTISDECIQEIPQKLDKHAQFRILIRQIYERNCNSKVLVFSEYDNSFYKIDKILNDEQLSYAYVKGVGINTIINKYKTSNETNILLVNSKSFGSGLNLENTTDVILFHKFDSQIEKQVIGRAQRPGRDSILNIHYLLYENEI
jgi:SNF2 family DNA or RNA helicase